MMKKAIIGTVVAALWAAAAMAQMKVNYEVALMSGTGSGNLAPTYISALRGGGVTQQHYGVLMGWAAREVDITKRLSWGAGVELCAAATSTTDYARFEDGAWSQHGERTSHVWANQAYVEAKDRGVLLTLGAKHCGSLLLDPQLSSGDLIYSGNARPMMGVKAGFLRFQNVPLTRGWLQVKGEVGYYKAPDDSWLENHYNYYNHFLTTAWWLNYKNIYLRSDPGQRFSVTFGMQAACQFGGDNVFYEKGKEVRRVKQKADAEAFFKALVPGSGGSNAGDNYYEGNHLGSWDLSLDYNLAHRQWLRAYVQKPWEDGSGIGLRNGWDGLYGVEWHTGTKYVEAAVVEYLDLTNQSGPIHWAPGDHEGTPITTEATGADDYYNNYAFNGYQVRGMSIGSPMVPSSINNFDGYMRFTDTRLRGVHVAVMGAPSSRWSYRLKGSYRAAWGTPFMPRQKKATCTSLMAQLTYTLTNHWRCSAIVASDRGSLCGDRTGGELTISYKGNLTFKKK